MKDDISTPTAEGESPNEFERDKRSTSDRSRAEAAIEDLRQRGGVFVNAVRATRMPMLLTDPNIPGNPIVFANEAFLKLSGYGANEVMGQQPHFMNGPGTDSHDVARFAEALRSDQDDIIETVQYRKDGSRFVATVLISAFKDNQGRTLNHFMSWLDVTRRVSAEEEVSELRKTQEALQASEAKYRGLFDKIDEGFCVIEVLFDAQRRPVDYVFLEANPAFERQTGMSNAIGRRMRDLAPAHEQHWFDIYGRIALTGEPQRFEQRAEALEHWYDVYAFRLGDEDEGHVAILFNDVMERKHAEVALHESRAHLAAELRRTTLLHDLSLRLVTEENLSSIYEEILSTAVAITESDAGTVQVYDPTTKSLALLVTHGIKPAMASYFQRVDAHSRTACGIALQAGKRTFVDFDEDETDVACKMHVEAGLRSAQATPVLARDGTATGMINTHWSDSKHRPSADQLRSLDLLARLAADVIEQRHAEAGLRESERHAQTLLAELQHRVRNTLAVVRSIARRTVDRSESVEDMLSHFEGRLNAFARIQAAVTRNAEGGVDLKSIVEDELVAVATREGRSLKIKGPALCLRPRTAESISLGIHELATNSVKYGAIAAPNGHIQVRWKIVRSGDADSLHFEWIESGLDTKPNVTHEGFGHEMLLRSLPYELGADTNIEFTTDGMRFTMQLPIGPDTLADAPK